MFDLNIRFQIASLLFLLIILYSYLSTNKLPLYSTRLFSMFLFFVTLNLVTDVATVYTLTHMDTVPLWVTRLAHQIFILSLNASFFGVYLYISVLGKNQKRYTLSSFITSLTPFLISVICVIFTPIYFYNDGKIAYSYGPMVISIFVSIAVYVSMTTYNSIRYRKILTAKTVLSVHIGISIWIIFAVIQFFFPQLLVSGLGAITIVLFLYLSYENPREHIDHDVGCFNKRAFRLILFEAIHSGRSFYIINVVVDDFSNINKHFGRNIGNLIIEKAVSVLSQNNKMQIYRSHTNSLTWFNYGNEDETLAFAEHLKDFFSQPTKIGKLTIKVKAHADILEYPRYATTYDEILDTLNYMAEQPVSDIFNRMVNPTHIKNQKRASKIEVLLRNAIENDGFDVHYQPIYSVREGAFTSAEALVRLRDTTSIGFIPPDEFITIAERRGLISELGEIVFEKVCIFIKENKIKNLGVSYIEVNLSGLQCIDYNLPYQLHSIMNKYNIEPECINLEITETASVESGELLHVNMEKLRAIGCSFSMDDFGTGYSNLSQIAYVSYDLVKIDKSIIWKCFEPNGTKALTVLSNVITMLHNLDVKIVAEGVETKEQAMMLSELSVDYLQGYFYSRPIKDIDYINFVKKHNNYIGPLENIIC